MKIAIFAVLIVILSGLSQPSKADNWCSSKKSPTISIRTSTDQVGYNFSLSEKQLNSFNITTVSPYANNVITDVGGLMKGGIETKQKMSFGTLINQRTGEVCFWHDNIDVLIHIKPTIYIANEFPQGSCMHKSIMVHEQKHITVDREIVNKYASLIGKALQDDVSRYSIFGPVPLAKEDATLSMIKNRMQTILKQYTDQMSVERRSRQQAVDNINEYNRVNKSCK